MALQYPATNFPLGRFSAISPFALATALLVVSLLGWSVGLTPSPEYVYFRAFSRQSRPCRLPDITTAPHWDLRRRDLHPQVQQLASLRSSSPPPGPKILTADGQLIGHPLAITAYRNHRRPEWLSRLSLTVGLAATALTVVVAVLIGGTTGFIGGRLDLVTQRFVDAWMAFPGLLLLLTIMSIAGRGMAQIIIVLGVSGGIPASVFRAIQPKVCSGLSRSVLRSLGARCRRTAGSVATR